MPPGKKPAAGPEPKSTIKGYKPPWIKEAAEPNKETETPWGIMKKRDAVDLEETKATKAKKRLSRAEDDDDEDSAPSFALPALRKVSLTKTDAKPLENGEEKVTTFAKPQLKSVKPPKQEKKKPAEEKDEGKLIIPKLNSVKVEKMKELPPPPKKETPDYRQVLKKTPTKDRFDEEKKRGAPPPPPMAPPLPPPPPALPKPINTDPLNDKQKQRLDSLRARPKARPDWTAVLKGIETGARLKHVQCNDRSKPLLPASKAKGQFLYESEKGNAHNVLLKEIQQGVKLNRVKTNDRSKPNLDGIRKIRRQMTIEDLIQKSVSMANMAGAAPLKTDKSNSIIPCDSVTNIPPEEVLLLATLASEADEMDDIDKVRDDLQSTKQLLAIEIKNKEQVMRENKRLLQKIQNLEKEKEIEKGIAKSEQEADKKREPDEKLIITLKAEAAEARKASEEIERRYTQTAKELDHAKIEVEEMKRRNSELEKKLQEFLCGKRVSVSDRRESQQFGDDEENGGESDTDSDEEETEEKKAKRTAREVKMLANKLHGFKNKVDIAKKERIALKEIMKKHQTSIKEEKKRYKQLQKEVDKMAALMKESDSDEDDEDEEKSEDEDSTETETSESDSESSDTDSESERSQSEPEDAPPEKKKENLVARMRRHENRLGALKKTNFMLKTNAERLQDELNNQKVQTQSLQADLDSVLAELG